MKHFKLILASIRILVSLLFAANVIFMVQLYDSIMMWSNASEGQTR